MKWSVRPVVNVCYGQAVAVWKNQYRVLDLERVKGLMKGRAFIDLRNVYEPKSMIAQGFEYTCVGQ